MHLCCKSSTVSVKLGEKLCNMIAYFCALLDMSLFQPLKWYTDVRGVLLKMRMSPHMTVTKAKYCKVK